MVMKKTTSRAIMLLISAMLIASAVSSVLEKNTDLNANGALADLVTVKTSYFRALCDANPLTWDQSLADKAKKSAWNCDLQYDYWSPEGQIIFRMVDEDNSIVNSPNATYFALQHWYDMRVNYTDIQSNEYDQLQPFAPAWEFTQMVWKSNTKIGCAYGTDAVCPSLDPVHNNVYQLYCLLTPGGNKWDQWGANVACKDCVGVQPQTSTVNTATISFPGRKRSVPYKTATPTTTFEPPNESVRASLEAAMHRIEQYLTMDNDEFMSRWDLPEATPTASITPTSSK